MAPWGKSIMVSNRRKRLVCLSAIVTAAVLGLVLLAFAKADPPGLSVLVMFGTLLGQTAVTAGWCALGPYSLARRVAISSVWLATIVIALSSNRAIADSGGDLHPVMTYALVVVS